VVSNYLLTAGAPFSPSPSAGWATTATWGPSNQPLVNLYDNSDNGYTHPAAVSFGWSASNTVAPTSGLTTAVVVYNYYWAAYNVTVPTTPGQYYLWGIAYNASGAVVQTCVSPVTFTIT
jgi:hypothetical protein